VENNGRLRTLTTRFDFLQLNKKGKKLRPAPWLTVSALARPGEGPRFGWVLPRAVGNAVIRNRLRRWVKAYVRERLSKGDSFDGDICFVFRKAPVDFYRQLKYREFEPMLRQVCDRVPLGKTR
jgi:ribonuclease P protein component